MPGKSGGKRKITVSFVVAETLTALLCIAFLYLALRRRCLGTITIFHIAPELFSIIVCQMIAFSLSRLAAPENMKTIAGASRGFRIYRGSCLVLVLLMALDAAAWICFGYLAEGTEFWMTAWYIIPMSALALAFAGTFRWMTVQSRKLEDSFRHLMSSNVATEIRKEDAADGRTAYVTVLFCQTLGLEKHLDEICGSEETGESGIHRLLRLFYTEAAEICEQHGGTALEFPGYCVLCVFGAPEPLEHHETAAVKAAGEIVAEMEALENLRGVTGFPSFSVGIGINTGNAHVGNVGNEKQKRFTVIGSSVNLASRIGSYAKPGEILISENVQKAVSASMSTEEVAEVMPKGFDEPVSIYRVKRDGGKL